MKPMTKSIVFAWFGIFTLGGCAEGTARQTEGEDGSEGTDVTNATSAASVEDDSHTDGHSKNAVGPGADYDYYGDSDTDSNPSETCDDGLDNNGDGNVDENCTCKPRSEQICYGGPPALAGIGECDWGVQQCEASGEVFMWGDCEGWKAPSAELCDGAKDEDCDGWIDNLESCLPCLRPQPHVVFEYPWQEHTLYGQQCYPGVVSPRCVESEYNYAPGTPGPGDNGWETHFDVDIDWSVPTNGLLLACNAGQGCAGGGQFTYFQTFFYLGSSYPVWDARVSIANVDDGVRITLYNDTYPSGVVVPGGYMCQNGTYTTGNFNGYLASGYNRIVMTQLDDCQEWSALQGVNIALNSIVLVACIPGRWGGNP